MKSVVLLLVFFFSLMASAELKAQSSISARITEERAGEPIAFATLVLYEGEKLVKGASADSDGSLKLEAIDPGVYEKQIQSLGYTTLKLTGIALTEGGVDLELTKQQTRLTPAVCLLDVLLIEEEIEPQIECFDCGSDYLRENKHDYTSRTTRCGFGCYSLDCAICNSDSTLGPDGVEDDFSANQKPYVFPNPTSGKIQIASKSKVESWSLIDIQGRTIQQEQQPRLTDAIDLQGLENGNYILVLQTGSGPESLKVVKTN